MAASACKVRLGVTELLGVDSGLAKINGVALTRFSDLRHHKD